MANACPRCGALLAPFSHNGVTLALCSSCRGMWFDAGELKRVLGAEPPALGAPASLEIEGGTPSPPCPRCAMPLVSRRLADDAALAVESCRRCGGMFLDRGELERVRRLARRPRHVSVDDRRAFADAVPDPNARRRVQTNTWKRIRAFTTAPPRARAQWHSFSTDGAGLMLLYLLGLPTEEKNPPLKRMPVVVYLLVLVNLLAWFSELASPGGLRGAIDFYGMVPSGVLAGERPWTLFTSMFVHASWWHVLGNMYFLWLFGDNVEDRLGHFAFLLLYLIAGAAAGGLMLLESVHPDVAVVGASGAIAGVMAAYMLLFPGSRIMAVFFSFIFWAYVVPVPAWLYLLFWLGWNALGAHFGVPGIAWWAHLGGFGAGFVVAWLFRMVVGPAAGDTGPRPAVAGG